MTERWRDFRGRDGFVFHPWMKTVDELQDQNAALISVLRKAKMWVPSSSVLHADIDVAIDSVEQQDQ